MCNGVWKLDMVFPFCAAKEITGNPNERDMLHVQRRSHNLPLNHLMHIMSFEIQSTMCNSSQSTFSVSDGWDDCSSAQLK